MRTRTRTLTALLAVAATTAEAHPGLHDMPPLQNLAHHLTEPDHLAIIGGAILVGWLVYRFLVKGKENG